MIGRRPCGAGDTGLALLPVLLLTLLTSAVVVALAVVTRIEVLVAARHHGATAALHAAEAGLHAAMSELRHLPDWTPVVTGARQSGLAEGPFAGTRTVPGVGAVTLCCDRDSAAGRLAAAMALSPVPARRRLQWRPFLWIAFDTLVQRERTGLFVIVWVANDEDDGGGPAADTNGAILMRAEAAAGGGGGRVLEALVARQPAEAGAPPEPARALRLHLLWQREIR